MNQEQIFFFFGREEREGSPLCKNLHLESLPSRQSPVTSRRNNRAVTLSSPTSDSVIVVVGSGGRRSGPGREVGVIRSTVVTEVTGTCTSFHEYPTKFMISEHFYGNLFSCHRNLRSGSRHDWSSQWNPLQ